MSLHPKKIDLTLDRMFRILEALGDPHLAIPPSVLFAGTNGKGSTLAMVRAGLEGAGKVCHAYTSPHLAWFHERIRIAGELITEAALAELLAEVEEINGTEPITYFEITTAAAFRAFARTPADYTLLEVGLGGRLDATNVVTPQVSVITPVSLDHEAFLGDTVGKIAFEKAGILKRGVPAVTGPQTEEGLAVIEEQAERVGAPLHMCNRDWQVWEEHGRMAYQDEHGLLDLPLPTLIGGHQVFNAGCALATLRLLGAHDAEAAVTEAEWPARLQRLRRGPLVEMAGQAELWLDGGHNPAAGTSLAEALLRLPARPLHLICGMLKTKDAVGYMRPMAEVAEALMSVTIPGEEATLTADEAAEAAREAGFSTVAPADSVADAVADIVARAPSARILICGSLYLAGAVLRDNG